VYRTLLKSKIHRATVTHCELHYEGSCGIDEDLLEASNIRPNEQVHIWNVNNGERFITYAIKSPRGSGIISLNGSAARRASVGDLVIIAAFGLVAEHELDACQPKLVFPDAHNRIVEVRSELAGPQAGDTPIPA
jgi:aspartate 1-decarboxylase